MSEYKGIKGFQVTTRTEDPVPFAQAIADNPYAGSWSSGGDLNTARYQGGGAGTQTAASLFGGGAPAVAVHEYYNGTSWSEQTDLNTGRYSAASGGTQTASLLAGGYTTTNVTNTETWNGSSWTETTEINTSRRGLSSLGQVNTAILAAGGYTTTAVNNVENWNGSSWTEIAEVTTTGYSGSGSGTNTEGLILNLHPSSTNQYWNGSSWTELADTNVPHSPGSGASQQGSYTAALIFGGADPSLAKTESWDGSSWTEVADLATARRGIRGAGTSTVALAMGGEIPPTVAATEEWAFSGIQPTDPAAAYADAIVGDFYYNSTTGQFKTVNDGGPPIGSWSSGGNLPGVLINQGAFGGRDSVTTGGGAGGGPGAKVADSFQYDGVSWSEIAERNTAIDQGAGLGTQNSGLIAGGATTTHVANTESWDGTSWAEIADVSPARTGAGSAGVYTAGLVFGGNTPPQTASTMTWNGSSWTEVNDLNSARNRFMGQAVGTQTAALAIAGAGTPGTESWDGTSWTEVNDMNTARYLGGGSGVQTSAIVSSGRTQPPDNSPNASCESWDGTSFTEVADVSSARAYLSSTGTAGGNPNTSSIIFGGATTSSTANTAATEEWNAAEFQIKSVTTS